MDPEQLVDAWWFIVFCLMVWLPIELPRRWIAKKLPNVATSFWWHDVALTTLPPVLGLLYAVFIKDFPYLVDQQSMGVRCGLGALAGFMSSFVVRTVKARLKSKTGIDLDPDSQGDRVTPVGSGSTLQ